MRSDSPYAYGFMSFSSADVELMFALVVALKPVCRLPALAGGSGPPSLNKASGCLIPDKPENNPAIRALTISSSLYIIQCQIEYNKDILVHTCLLK